MQLTVAILVWLRTFNAFLNGVGVLGDIVRRDLLILGVRNGSSAELDSLSIGVCRVTFSAGVALVSAGVDVTTLLSQPAGVFRN